MTTATDADVIIEGRVATLAGDSGFGWQSGLAIAGGRVLAVGPPAELADLAGPRTRRWTLTDDQLVMPGITDAHLHLMTLTLAEQQIDLTGLGRQSALDAIADRHRSMTATGTAEGWLLGHGWSVGHLGGWPDAAMLDAVAPGRPVALWAHDHHSRWISGAAIRRAGLSAESPDPDGGLIRRDSVGAPTGILHETAGTLIDPVVPEPPRIVIEEWLRSVGQKLLALGITGCHDPGELTGVADVPRIPLFYRDLARADRLPLRVHASIRAPQLEQALQLGLTSGQAEGRYSMGWLKLFADGSLGSRSAALLEPYADADADPPTGGPRGMALMERDELEVHVRRAAAGGISSQIHAIGDAAVRTVLDVFAATPPGPLTQRIEHAQLVDPADQRRFGELGVAASVQPVHLRSDAEQARAAWGRRSENAFPLRGLLDGGALIPFGSDAPVEPPDPWPGIAIAVARRDPGDPLAQPLGAAHRIDLARAMRAACLDPALVAGDQDLGRLLPGYRADLLVLPAAGFAEPFDPATLAATRPWATLIDGFVAHLDE